MALYEPLFKALNTAEVRYVVVGGLAVVLQGYARLTVDVDLAVDLDEREALKAIDALVGLGLQPRAPVDARDFANRSVRASWIRERDMRVFSLIDPSNPMRVVDLFADHPIPFGDLWTRSEMVELRGTSVRVASIPDLIRMKRIAGRSQDLIDIEHLEAILAARRGNANG